MDNKIEKQTNMMSPSENQEDLPVLLVVDDDPDILRVVRFYLTKQNYLVHTASNGQEAISIMEKERDIELILSDVMMPEMTGLELLRFIRKDPEYGEVPVILISAEGETSKKVIGLNLGADDFITKPFNFDELMARVKNHVRLRRLQKEVMIASKQILQANDMLQKQNDRLLEDLEAARQVQMALMPDELPSNENFTLASRYVPAERLGGDFFDVVCLEDGKKLGILVADVVGHGVTAAFITAMTKISFQNACFASPEPSVVLERMNRELSATLRNGYVTVFYGVFDRETNTFSYASGGHPPLILHRRESSEVIELNSQATFLGYFDPLEFESDSIALQKGDRILFYTDGLYESHPDGEDEFGRDRMIQLILDHPDDSIQAIIDRLVDELVKFMQGQHVDDDLTIVGIDILT